MISLEFIEVFFSLVLLNVDKMFTFSAPLLRPVLFAPES